jgi:hypothetical protein
MDMVTLGDASHFTVFSIQVCINSDITVQMNVQFPCIATYEPLSDCVGLNVHRYSPYSDFVLILHESWLMLYNLM